MFDKKVTAIIISAVASLNLLFYLSMRSVLGFIGFYLHFPFITYILGFILAVVVVISFIDLLHKHNKTRSIVLFILDCIFTAIVIPYFIVQIANFKVIFLEMAKLLVVYAAVAIIVYLIFYFHKSKIYTKTIATIVCIVLVLAFVIGFTDISNLTINYFTTGAAVYAVEDDYQIVWATKSKALGYVEIAGVKYYDEIAGSIRSTDTVHKVAVPQSVLDNAKSYTIFSKTMINEEAYSALRGRTFSKTYAFRPVDTTDGVQYYAVSDTHGNNSKAVAAASYYGAATDFVIIAGDAVSYFDNRYDLERIVNLVSGMTGGNIPAIYARGNHEVKGKSAESLHKYVGANETNSFYFQFRIGSVWGVVLDMGEDHPDDWTQFFGTANFAPYRNAQIEMLDNLIADKENSYEAQGVTHKIAISHMNTAFVSNGNFFMYDFMIELNRRLNNIGIDVMVSGHLHQTFVAPKGMAAGTELKFVPSYTGDNKEGLAAQYHATGAMYDTVICARRSDIQAVSKKERNLGRRYTGTALQFDIDNAGDKVMEIRFTTNKKKVLNIINPFTGDSLGNTIYIY